MKKTRHLFRGLFALITSVSFILTMHAQTQAPAGEQYVSLDLNGTTVLPNGRLLTPHGKQIHIAPSPFGMTLSEDGNVLITVNGGTGPFSLTVVKNPASSHPQVMQIPPGPATNKEMLRATFIGAAVDTETGRIYASGGDDGTIVVFNLHTGDKLETIRLSTEEYPDAYTTDVVLSHDRRWLYALDLANYRLVTIDTRTSRIVSSIGVGRNPFAFALTADGSKLYVANMGTFRYAPIETHPGDDPRGIPFPPFGYPSKEAEQGTVVGGRKVPGLGDPNVPEACSVWGVDVSDPENPQVAAQIKTGLPVGQAVGGSSPAGLAVSQDTLYVSNSVNDTIEAYDLKTHKRKWRSLLTPGDKFKNLRGTLPFGIALDPDSNRLYVAESGMNSVAVLDARSGRMMGRIPAGWYPARVAVSPDGSRLYVSNAKGIGSGPNGGRDFKPGPEGTYVGSLMKGTLSLMPVPAEGELSELTRIVLRNNGLTDGEIKRDPNHPVPARAGKASQKIKHVIFITKENRTFDEVFGAMPGVRGDASLVKFGVPRKIGTIEDVVVMPNHAALARQFAISDNFYVNSDVSADGHRWLVGVYTNHWVETMTSAGYGGGASFKRSKAPGRLAFFGANSSLTPEDYLEHGSMWEHYERHKIRFRNYGEGFELAGISEDADTKPTGARLSLNIPMPYALFKNTSRTYPGYNMNIPDQYRADQFLKEFRENHLSGAEPLPAFIYMHLPNDHGAGPRPEKGYPFTESYMADNDLALGRIVEALSHSPFWKEMAIFVTEDDAQAGVDSVDAHRSLLMVISPYAKRGYVSHVNVSISSIMKTIYHLLGLPNLNLTDALASDLGDCFTPLPDFTPYRAVPVDGRLFDPEKAKDPHDPDYLRARREPSIEMDGMEEALRQIGKK